MFSGAPQAAPFICTLFGLAMGLSDVALLLPCDLTELRPVLRFGLSLTSSVLDFIMQCRIVSNDSCVVCRVTLDIDPGGGLLRQGGPNMMWGPTRLVLVICRELWGGRSSSKRGRSGSRYGEDDRKRISTRPVVVVRA